MAKTRINIRQVDFELKDGDGNSFETMADADQAGKQVVGKLVPTKFNPKYLGIELAVGDYVGVDGKAIVNLDLLNNKVSTLQAADDALQTNINSEAAARSAADQTLQDNIDAEATARAAADSSLESSITTEVSDRQAADSVLQAAIDAEAATRAGEDAILSGQISDLGTTVGDNYADFLNASSSLKADMDAADGALQAAIDAEAATRAGEDAILSGQISDLGTTVGDNYADFLNASSSLKADIDAEAATRSGADAALQAAIDAEVTTRAAADAVLQGNIDAEATARSAADAAIQADVDANEAASDAADAALQAQIDTSAADIANLVSDVQTLWGRNVRYNDALLTSGSFVKTPDYPMDVTSLQVFVNGLLKTEGFDYAITLSGSAAESIEVYDTEVGDDVVVIGKFHFELAS